MYKNLFILSVVFLSGIVRAEQPSIKPFIEKYVDASLTANSHSLESLFYDVWNECRASEYNEMMKSHFVEIISDIDFQLEYKYELLPIVNIAEQQEEEKAFFLGIDDVEYYPAEPSHELRITQHSGSSSTIHSSPVIVNEGNWYFVHACAGNGMKKYLQKINANK